MQSFADLQQWNDFDLLEITLQLFDNREESTMALKIPHRQQTVYDTNILVNFPTQVIAIFRKLKNIRESSFHSQSVSPIYWLECLQQNTYST